MHADVEIPEGPVAEWGAYYLKQYRRLLWYQWHKGPRHPKVDQLYALLAPALRRLPGLEEYIWEMGRRLENDGQWQPGMDPAEQQFGAPAPAAARPADPEPVAETSSEPEAAAEAVGWSKADLEPPGALDQLIGDWVQTQVEPDVCSKQTSEQPPAEHDLTPADEVPVVGAGSEKEEIDPDLSDLSNHSCRRIPCLFTGCSGQYLPMDVGRWACSANPAHLAWQHAPEILAYRSIYGTTNIRYSDWLSGEAKPLGKATPKPDPESPIDLTPSPEAAVVPAAPDYGPLYVLPDGTCCAYCQAALSLAEDRPDVWYCTADRRHRLWSSGIGSGVWLDVAEGGRSFALKLPRPAWMERALAYAAELEQEKAAKAEKTELKKAAKPLPVAA